MSRISVSEGFLDDSVVLGVVGEGEVLAAGEEFVIEFGEEDGGDCGDAASGGEGSEEVFILQS